jgi:hypothetical protein
MPLRFFVCGWRVRCCWASARPRVQNLVIDAGKFSAGGEETGTDEDRRAVLHQLLTRDVETVRVGAWVACALPGCRGVGRRSRGCCLDPCCWCTAAARWTVKSLTMSK